MVWYGPKSAVKPCGSPQKNELQAYGFVIFCAQLTDSAPALVKVANRCESPILDSPVAIAGANNFFRGRHPVEPLQDTFYQGIRLVLVLA